jgi:aminodeoxyfutalosine deaminase
LLLTAARIHDGRNWLPAGSVIAVDDDGTIKGIHDASLAEDALYYDGVLCPGFVNAHCHIELSHMLGVIPEHTGLIPFLQKVFFHRGDHNEEQKLAARHKAYYAMLENGIVAVGDISNVNDTLDVRALGKMHIHSFVEAIGFSQTPQKQFEHSVKVYDTFAAQQSYSVRLTQSITPHAPYSVSQTMFGLIDKHDENAVLSIHNQESLAEDEYYLLKQGDVQTLLHSIGIDDSFFIPPGKSSLQTYLQWLSASHGFMFVHNTFTKRADVEVAKVLLPEVYWCLCPNANKYIENALPDIPMFMEKGAKLCIGTDSLASNHQLSVLAELVTIRQAYSAIGWEQLLQWATYNGACALRMQDIVGSIEPGKKPGILHLTGIDNNNPKVKRII